MTRYYSRDVLTFLVTYLTTNLNSTIQAINTTRTDTTPDVISFIYANSQNQFPECFVSIDDSEVEVIELGKSFDGSNETYNCSVIIGIKSNDTNLNLWVENYIEAIFKTLHGYSDNNISWIACKSSIRDEINIKEMQTFKVCGWKIEVRIY
jgi:hypothetical protein